MRMSPTRFTLLEGVKGVQLAESALKSWKERRWIDVARSRPEVYWTSVDVC